MSDDESFRRELGLQHFRQKISKAHCLLEGSLCEGDVSADLLEAAQAIKDIQCHNDRQRNAKAHQCLRQFTASAPRLDTSTIWAEPSAVAQIQRLGDRKFNYVVDAWRADVFACQNPSNPPLVAAWTCALQGGCLVSIDFVTSGGKHGCAFEYEPAVATKRRIFLSPATRI